MARREVERTKVEVDDVVAQLASLLEADRKDDALGLVASLLGKLVADNEKLALDVMRLLKRHNGQTSERISAAQLSLLAAIAQAEAAPAVVPEGDLPAPVVEEKPQRTREKKKGHGRKLLPAHLPRIEAPINTGAVGRALLHDVRRRASLHRLRDERDPRFQAVVACRRPRRRARAGHAGRRGRDASDRRRAA